MDKIKLATHDLCNETAEMSHKVHQNNILMNFINKSVTMTKIEETTKY